MRKGLGQGMQRGMMVVLALGMGCQTATEQGVAEAGDDAVAVEPTGLSVAAVYSEDQWHPVNGIELPQSAHPYTGNLREGYAVDAPGCALAIRLRFGSVELRSGDSLSIYDNLGRRVQRIVGYHGAFISNTINGNAATLVLRTNRYGQAFGFEVEGVDMVEGPMPCPRPPWYACRPDEVAVSAPLAACTCPQPPVCEPVRDFDASLGAGGGFSGGYGGWVVRGNGELVRVRQLTAGDPQTEEVVGWASLDRLVTLASETHSSGFFTNTPPSNTGNMTSTFSAHQLDTRAAVSWETGSPEPRSLQYVVAAFEKAITCGSENGDAVCARGYVCQEARCEQAPSCVCPRYYAPLCGVSGNTYGNACELNCAGDTQLHEGPCGQAGDVCGGLAQRTCDNGLECTYTDADGSKRNYPTYNGEQGVCTSVEVACRCVWTDDPMCGVDGVTYANPCETGCRGIEVAHPGACGAEGDRCNDNSGCNSGLSCQDGVCAPEGCVCPQVYMPVCGVNHTTYGNSCEAGCADMAVAHEGACGANGDDCGGIAGFACQEGLRCHYEDGLETPPYPDAMGVCRPMGWCDAPVECGRTVRLSCPATWYCEDHACRYECNTPEERWEEDVVTFQSEHPYQNSTLVGWTARGEPETLAIRFEFSAFATEQGYDFVILYNEQWEEVVRYSGQLGAFTTAEVPGTVAHLVFSTDRSVTDQGFVGVKVQYKVP